MENEILIQKAIEQLAHHTGIKAQVDNKTPAEIDGRIKFRYNNQLYHFFIEVKKELRNHQLPQLEKLRDQYHPLMVLAEYIFPKIKGALRQQNIGYLEANGNVYLKEGDLFLWLEGQKPEVMVKKKAGRAFTKTGLKVVFHFLLNEDWVNLTYREIAHRTGIGFGNINFVMTDLKEQGFLLEVDKTTLKLINKKELLNKWMEGYEQKLKPALQVGRFRFLHDNDFLHWEKVPLNTGKTWWGGEPAGDLLTKYLKPAELTIYTLEKRNELIKNYRLIPDDKGTVKVYLKFWHNDALKTVVPPLLTYVDLMITGDRRCIETAQKIYDAQLQNQF